MYIHLYSYAQLLYVTGDNLSWTDTCTENNTMRLPFDICAELLTLVVEVETEYDVIAKRMSHSEIYGTDVALFWFPD